MQKSSIEWLLAAGLLWALSEWRRIQRRRREHLAPEQVEMWEAEGGALPQSTESGGQQTLEPAERST